MNRGFTLLEVIIAAIILAIIATFTMESLRASFQTEQSIAKASRNQRLGTSVIMKMREDLRQTFHVQSPKPLTYFKGTDQFDRDELTFTSMSHSPTEVYAKESDQAEIGYRIRESSENPGTFVLERRESRYIDDDPENGGAFVTLAPNVLMFNIEYSLDGITYQPTWDLREGETRDKLPKLVKIELRLQDESGREDIFESLVDIPMSAGIGAEPQAQPPTSTPSPSPTPQPTPGQNPGSFLGGSI